MSLSQHRADGFGGSATYMGRALAIRISVHVLIPIRTHIPVSITNAIPPPDPCPASANSIPLCK